MRQTNIYSINICLFLLTICDGIKSEVINIIPNREFLKKDIPIIDIRTRDEIWSSGKLDKSINIPFFNNFGEFDIKNFKKELKEKIDINKPFAIICYSGNRSTKASKILSRKYHFTIFNLIGGIIKAKNNNCHIE